jgi:hypothetical protein
MNDNTPETDRQWANWLQELKNPIESFVNFARKLERERDEAREERDKIRTELEMWRDGNIMHEIHRNELEKAERERDEAREAIRAALAEQWLLDPQCAEDQALVDRLIEAARD